MGAAALFAVLSSVSFGVGDVLSGVALRRHTIAALAMWTQLTGLVLIAVIVAVVRPTALQSGLVWGAAAGALGALAVLAFYTALQRGNTTVVAPVAGCGVLVPVLAGILRGEDLSWRAAAGSLAAVVGVLVVARAGDGREAPSPQVDGPATLRPLVVPARGHMVPGNDSCIPARTSTSHRSAVRFAALSAAGLGGFFVVLDHATTEAGRGETALGIALAVALAVQAGALAVTLIAATRHTRRCLRLSRGLIAAALTIGLLNMTADLLLNVAVGTGPLAVVGPLGSLAPVVAVILATAVLRQRVRRTHGLGIVTVLVGIGLIVTG